MFYFFKILSPPPFSVCVCVRARDECSARGSQKTELGPLEICVKSSWGANLRYLEELGGLLMTRPSPQSLPCCLDADFNQMQ